MWITDRRQGAPGRRRRRAPAALAGAAALLSIALASGCRQDMHNQPKYKPLAASDFFADGRSARPAVAGTVPRGGAREDDLLYTGKTPDGKPSDLFPFAMTEEVLNRGHGRFDIFCAPCHDRLGTGRGMVVRRGFPPAASLHIDRLRAAQPGYFFDVITNGFGRMPGYAAQIPVRDRWAIIGWVRVLQRSEAGTLDDVPAEERPLLLRKREGR